MRKGKFMLLMVAALLLGSFLCACQSAEDSAESQNKGIPDAEYVYEQVKILNVQLETAGVCRAVVDNEAKEPVNLLFVQSQEYINIPAEQYSYDFMGIYMLDMDTGNWYDSSFLDHRRIRNLMDRRYLLYHP